MAYRSALLAVALVLSGATAGWHGARAQRPSTAVERRSDERLPTDTLPLAEALTALTRATGTRFSYETTAMAGVRVGAASAKTWDALRGELERRGFAIRVAKDGAVLLARSADASPKHAPAADANANALALTVLGRREGPLPGATVRLPDGRGGVTDSLGRTRLPSPSVPVRAEVSYLGYLTRGVTLAPGQRERVVVLWPDTVAMSVVEVTAPLPPRDWREGLPPGARGDYPTLAPARLLPARTLEGYGFSALAGASQIDAAGAAPALRGSAGYETRVELDGIPLYHVDHLFGLFSAIDPALVERVEVYRSHYPADRGGARGGLMDVTTVAEAEPGGGFDLEAGLSTVAADAVAHAERGPASLLIGARTSLGDVGDGDFFAASASDEVTAAGVPAFRFHDAYARLDVGREGAAWRGRLNAYRSRDGYAYGLSEASLLSNGRVPRTLTLGYGEESRWRNDGFGASLMHRRGGLTYALEAHATAYAVAMDVDAAATVDHPRRPRAEPRERALLDNDLDNDVGEQQLGVSVGAPGGAAPWEAGVQLQRLATTARYRFDTRRTFRQDGEDVRGHAYGMRQWRLGGTTAAETGLRVSYGGLFGEAWVSPRVTVRQEVLAKAGPPHSGARGRTFLRAGYSYTRQTVTALQHQNQFGQNYDLLVLELPGEGARGAAHNLTAGVSHERAGVRLEAEAYFRALPGVVANLSAGRTGGGDLLLNPQPTFQTVAGDGEVMGVDVDVAYRRGALSGTAAYTLSRSRQRFGAINRGAWLSAPDDRRHRLALTQAFVLGGFTVGLDYEAASGLVYNDVTAALSAPVRARTNPEQLQRRLPAYHRVDLRGEYRWAPTWGAVTVALRLHNVLDRLNVSQRAYVIGLGQVAERGLSLPVGTDVGLLGRVLVGEVRVRL